MFNGENAVMFHANKVVQDSCFSSDAGEHPLPKWGFEMSDLGHRTPL